MSEPLPPEAYAVALACLPGMGPARLVALAGTWPMAEAWRQVEAGTAASAERVAEALGRDGATLPRRWAEVARGLDPAALLEEHRRLGVGVAVIGSTAYPEALATDHDPPAVLFHLGRLDLLPGPRVTIVGTRRSTRYGIDLAFELGRDLAVEGVRVVSGLALGIDGAAHRGALAADAAPPVAVVGSGLDVLYPRRHAALWKAVEERGAVLSEAPLGARPERWRFPSRNRLLAALADVVVVVESHDRGGSLHTVDAALERDRPVMAVPGPVRSPASAGCNRLIADGMQVARDAADVLSLLGLSATAQRRGTPDPRPVPDSGDQAVLDAVAWQPAALEQLALRTQRPLGELAVSLERLVATGWLSRNAGWYERVARPDV